MLIISPYICIGINIKWNYSHYICVCMYVCMYIHIYIHTYTHARTHTHTHTHTYIYIYIYIYQGFPDSSFGKESAWSGGDSSLIPGSGRSTGDGIGYPLQHSWASLLAQLVKNPPAMQETWVWSLGLEDALEKGKNTIHSSILAWRIPWTI